FNDAVEPARQTRTQGTGKRRTVVSNGANDGDGVGAVKGALSRGRLVQHASQREEIRASVERLAACLFGRHVGNSAGNRAGSRQRVRGDVVSLRHAAESMLGGGE